MGVVPPAEGSSSDSVQTTKAAGSLLIFDEVITGFRVARRSAELLRIEPDLTCLGKIIGGAYRWEHSVDVERSWSCLPHSGPCTKRVRFREIRDDGRRHATSGYWITQRMRAWRPGGSDQASGLRDALRRAGIAVACNE
jgi:hypothetical protein